MTFRPYNAIAVSGHDRTNNSGVTIVRGTPVRINTSGYLDFIDVSIENDIAAISGIVLNDIANGSSGSIANSGKVDNITTTANFGDLMFVSKTGGLTNVRPDIGIGGFLAEDWVIMAGVVAKNELNPTIKDLIISIDIQGRL